MNRKSLPLYILSAICLALVVLFFLYRDPSPRSETLLRDGWKFMKGDVKGASEALFDDSSWESVTVPHDWAITGPFDRRNDLQRVAVSQNFESEATLKTGRTGGLPYVGVGWYRTVFEADTSHGVTLLFDGAMSQPQVYVNGIRVAEWKLGYNSFFADLAGCLKDGENVLAVRLENLPQSSRWYPGAGLFRNVHLIQTEKVHIPVWGVCVTTPQITRDKAEVKVSIAVENADRALRVCTVIRDEAGRKVATAEQRTHAAVDTVVCRLQVDAPQLWSPEHPHLYTAHTEIYSGGSLVDKQVTRFGIRSVRVVPDKGFLLNGEVRKFRGVCNHHDLGPLGAAVNKSALRHQLELLKEMGCDAIRTSHNMPAPELVELCDEMGFMMMVEAFDEWDMPKCENGYHLWFDEWAERDMVNMVRHFRNNPSVVMWSIGNEVPTQCSSEGYRVAQFLQDICHREDPTRPVTCGLDQVRCVLDNGFARVLDVVGLNYRTQLYKEAYALLPHKLVLGSETASTVSSRGIYKFPLEVRDGATYRDHQSSSYDVECCWWSNIPDIDFALADDYPWTMGQFVWTGFDYLGEPTPYDTNAWPSHSSLFGIIDLASLPKDRYYLYRSIWNDEEATLHVLPHWTWPERKGRNVPVMCYTSYPAAELFVNGVSQGIHSRDTSLLGRYRIIWPDVTYEPGTIEVVAYDAAGVEMDRTSVSTAGKPHHLALSTSRSKLSADGEDVAYVTVRVEDEEGNLCPWADNLVEFEVTGEASFRAAANGDPTCTYVFHKPQMPAFSGCLTAIVQASTHRGKATLTASSEGLESASIELSIKK